MMPLVSVVIPCFNSGSTLLRSINSIERQTFNSIEIIVVDDASTDPLTRSVIQKLSPVQVRVIEHNENLGLSQARNSGFQAALGAYVLFLDADDYFEANAIEEMLHHVPTGIDRFFIYTDIAFFGSKLGSSERKYYPFSQLMRNKFPYSVMIPKLAIDWESPYCEDFRLGLEDWDFNLNMLERGFVPVRVEKPLFNYFVSENGMFRQHTERNYFSIWIKIIRKRNRLYSWNSLSTCFKKEVQTYPRHLPIIPILLFLLTLFPNPKILDFLFVSVRKLIRRISSESRCAQQ